MTITQTRLTKIEQRFGADDHNCGPMAMLAPNVWSDADRAAWERFDAVPDADLEADLVEKYTGVRQRPCDRGHVITITVPAPAAVEQASEDERAAWRLAHGMRA